MCVGYYVYMGPLPRLYCERVIHRPAPRLHRQHIIIGVVFLGVHTSGGICDLRAYVRARNWSFCDTECWRNARYMHTFMVLGQIKCCMYWRTHMASSQVLSISGVQATSWRRECENGAQNVYFQFL